MTGNAKNTNLWQNADVYIAPENTVGPTTVTAAWAAEWKLVGLLDGAEGFTEAREQETSEKYAWGGVLFKRTSGKFKRTFKFVALEDNETTFALVNPGSTRATATGVRTATIKTPTVGARFAIGFELKDGARTKRRFARMAEVQEIGEIKESEEDPTVFEITVVIFPETNGTLYTTIETDPGV